MAASLRKACSTMKKHTLYLSMTLALAAHAGSTWAAAPASPAAVQLAADSKAALARYDSDKKLCNDETSSNARLQCRRDAKAEYDQALAAAKAKAAMLKTTEALQHRDTSIWVFPEGTRNLGKGMLPFKKGAFQMAIAAGVPIVQICCSNYKRTMRLNRWHSGPLRIRALPPLPTAGLTLDDMPALMERCREQMVACIASLDTQTHTVP